MIENRTEIFLRFRSEYHNRPKNYSVNLQEDILKIWQLYEQRKYEELCKIEVEGDCKIILRNMKIKIRAIIEKRTVQKYNLIRHMAKQEMIKNLERIFLENENDEIFLEQLMILYKSF